MTIETQITYLKSLKKEFKQLANSANKNIKGHTILIWLTRILVLFSGPILTVETIFVLWSPLIVILGLLVSISEGLRTTFKSEERRFLYKQILTKCQFQIFKIKNFLSTLKQTQAYFQNNAMICESEITPEFTDEKLQEVIFNFQHELGEIGLAPFTEENVKRMNSIRL